MVCSLRTVPPRHCPRAFLHGQFLHKYNTLVSNGKYFEEIVFLLFFSFIIYIINTKKKFTHTSITLHTDYIHDKYNIDYVKYKHTHTYT